MPGEINETSCASMWTCLKAEAASWNDDSIELSTRACDMNETIYNYFLSRAGRHEPAGTLPQGRDEMFRKLAKSVTTNYISDFFEEIWLNYMTMI